MVAVFPSVGLSLEQPSSQSLAMSTLRAGEPTRPSRELLRMLDLFAAREREQGGKAGIDADRIIGYMRDLPRRRVDEQTEIPAGRTFDQPTALNAAFWNVLSVELQSRKPGDVDAIAYWTTDRLPQRDTDHPVSTAFQLRRPSKTLPVTLPRQHHGIGDALKDNARYAESHRVALQQGMEVEPRDSSRRQFLLANGPIPDAT